MKTCSLISLLFLLAVSVYALDTSPRSAAQNYRLINADQLSIRKHQDEYFSDLSGNVHFFYGKTEFYADRVKIFKAREMAILTGNVQVYEDSLEQSSQYAKWDNQQEVLILENDVLFVEHHADGSLFSFTAQKVKYERTLKKTTATESVEVYSSKDNIKAWCGFLEYHSATGYGYMLENPLVLSENADSLRLTAQKIEYYRHTEKIIAQFAVEAQTLSGNVTGDFLFYQMKEEKAIVQGSPEFFSEFADARAQEFYFYFKNKKMIKAELRDSCYVNFVPAQGSPKTNHAWANSIDLSFQDSIISACTAEGNVITNIVSPPSQDAKNYYKNNASGSSLQIDFDADKKVKSINMQGQVKGKYLFNNKSVDK